MAFFQLSYTVLYGNSGSSKNKVLFSVTLSQSLDVENFLYASQLCYQQNLLMVELIDHTHDGRHIAAGCT